MSKLETFHDVLFDELKASNGLKNQPGISSATKAALFLLVFGALTSYGTVSFAENRQEAMQNEHDAAEYKADNTGRNTRDENSNRETAGDQDLTGNNTELLATIRKAVVDNDKLSTYAHNVKIMIEDGTVILRGPVRTAEEKAWIANKAAELAPKFEVVNELEIAPG